MSLNEKQHVLVTGANGLLGSHFLRSVAGKCQLTALVRQRVVQPVERVTYCELDLSKPWRLEQLPPSVDTVIHLAQSENFRDFPLKALDIFSVNVDSTARLLDYANAVGARRFILASSGGVYGMGDQAFHENSPIPHHGQLGYYLGSKLCSEVLVRNYAHLMDVAVLRFFFMYGPGQKRSMLIPRLIDNVRNGVPLKITGQDGIRINPLYVQDAVSALKAALSLEGSHTINIAGPEVLSLREIAEIIGEIAGRAPLFDVSDGDPQDLMADIRVMSELLCPPSCRLRDSVMGLF